MQFIFDLIWDQSRSRYFNGSARGSAVIEASAGILALVSLAIFAAHAVDAHRTG
jgi:hypothetical protein